MKQYPHRKIGTFPVWLLTVMLVSASQIASAADPVAGKDYTVYDPAKPTDSPGKIEVLEFFSYACPHCNDFNPVIGKWAAALPKDVVFKRIAVPGSAAWTNTARLYYTLEAMGDLPKFDGAVFDAIHKEGVRFTNENNMAAWIGGKGGDAVKFKATYNSFGINSRMQSAAQMAETYRIEGVPALTVNGKYFVPLSGSFEGTLATVDKLVEKIRTEKPKGK